ncbi:phytanoyl-CoA dioxygenase family protein [Kribbella sp. NPDC048928]|uniref:phytanoyl-CoA dioxygenase family protein n=1 Tax=Kribbella sp. NPDC048928 TaxID=3364111 RepID=UPI003718B672
MTTISSDYALTDTERLAFERRGFQKLRGVIDPEELRPFADEITDQVIRLNTQSLPLAERDLYSRAFLQVTNLWRQSALVEKFVRSTDLARLAADLLGVESVRLYHDQALYKERGGGITPWHADQYYWPLSTDRAVTIWIPLQDTPLEAGPLSFATGSHRFQYARDLPISAESEQRIAELMLEQQYAVDAGPYALGDVSYHLGWTFHRAGENTADFARRVMTIIYVDAGMVIGEPRNDNQVKDLAAWAPGRKPGDRLDTELNPVLYP